MEVQKSSTINFYLVTTPTIPSLWKMHDVGLILASILLSVQNLLRKLGLRCILRIVSTPEV